MDFCQSLDTRKGTLGEELDIVDESGGLMNCMGGVIIIIIIIIIIRGNRT